jgi:hypothetical protein
MTEEEFAIGVASATEVYPSTRLLPPNGNLRPLRVAPIPIPVDFWGGGSTRLLIVFNLTTHAAEKPRGLLGPEWKLPGGRGAPHNASPVFEFGEQWQGYSWNFPWPPALGVVDTIETYLGRFGDQR